MYVIREAQEHHRNVELYLYRKVCLLVRLSFFEFFPLISLPTRLTDDRDDGRPGTATLIDNIWTGNVESRVNIKTAEITLTIVSKR